MSGTPLQQAQEIIYEAVEQDDPELQVKMAQEALAICSDCADAYVLLAENANSTKEQLEMYEQGMRQRLVSSFHAQRQARKNLLSSDGASSENLATEVLASS